MSKGKFASQDDEALYHLAEDGNDWAGSDEFGVSAALVILDKEDAALFAAPEGIFIVSETDQGFVEVESFDNEDAARTALAAIERAYDKFLQDEADDPWIPETAPGWALT